MSERDLLFVVTRKDFDETHIRGSGAGGQHRNKVSTGVRLHHRASGATAESVEHKSQDQNRRAAWRKIRETPEWKVWFRDMVAATSGRKTVQERLDEMMMDDKIITQILDQRNRWVTVSKDDLSG